MLSSVDKGPPLLKTFWLFLVFVHVCACGLINPHILSLLKCHSLLCFHGGWFCWFLDHCSGEISFPGFSHLLILRTGWNFSQILIHCSCYLGRKNLKYSYKGFKMKCPYFDLKILILKCWLATSVLKSNKRLSIWINYCFIDFLKYLMNLIGNLKKELSVAQLINCALFPLLRKFVETLFPRQP